METLPGIWSLSPLGALIGAVVILYWMLGTGRLIPKSSHERELEQADKRASRADMRGDEWKETALTERAVNQEIRRQNTLMLEASRTATKFFADAPIGVEDTGDQHVAR